MPDSTCHMNVAQDATNTSPTSNRAAAALNRQWNRLSAVHARSRAMPAVRNANAMAAKGTESRFGKPFLKLQRTKSTVMRANGSSGKYKSERKIVGGCNIHSSDPRLAYGRARKMRSSRNIEIE